MTTIIEEAIDFTWTDKSACKGQDPSKWYPVSLTDRAGLQQIRLAVTTCNSCPVQQECLDYSLEWERFGIWGGLNAEQRDLIRKKNNISLKRKR
jgi:hypothetical protein